MKKKSVFNLLRKESGACSSVAKQRYPPELLMMKSLKTQLEQLKEGGRSKTIAGVLSSLAVGASLLLSSSVQAEQSTLFKPLVVAVEPNSAPYAFLEESLELPVGLELEVVNELQRRLGFQLKDDRFFPMDHDRGFEMLKNGQIDIYIGGKRFRPERLSDMSATRPIYQAGLGVMYSKNFNKVRSVTDLKKTRIGVFHDDAEYYSSAVFDAEVIRFSNAIMAYYQLTTGQIDAVIGDKPSLEFFASTVPQFNLAVSGEVFDIANGNFVFYLQKNSPYLNVINETLTSLESDGTIYQLRRKWRDKINASQQ